MFRGKPTGVANYIINLVRNLEALDRVNRYFVFVTDSNKGYFPFSRENFQPVICPDMTEIPTMRRLWEQLVFPLMINRYKIDVLHCPVNVLPLLTRCKTAVTILDCQYFHASARHNFFRKSFNSLFMQASYGKADMVMTISDSMKQEIVGYFGGNNSKVFTTHLGQEFCAVDPLPGLELEERFGVSQPYLLFVGFPNHRKNLPGLIRAFALALQRLSETFDLVICGDIHTKIESDYPMIVKTIEEKGMNDRVKFIGYVENGELQSLISGARGFVFPSLYEGFGLPVVEAMACGTPVLVSDIPVLREIAGDAAIYVDPNDDEDISSGICRLLSDEPLRAALRVKGAARAAEFTWRETARKTLECYLRLGKGNRG